MHIQYTYTIINVYSYKYNITILKKHCPALSLVLCLALYFSPKLLVPYATREHNSGAQTQRPKTKRPKGQNVPRQNVPRHKVQGQNVSRDKTSQGQNVPRDKTSQETKRPNEKKILHFNFQFFKKDFVRIFLKMGHIC